MTPTSDSHVQRRPGGRSARVRADVLRAALEELADVGYGTFALEGVARRAGVHRTTLYRRWGTREQLALEAMLVAAQTAVPIPDTGTLRGDLLAYADAIAINLSRPEIGAIVRSIAAEAPHNDALAEAGRQFWRSRFELAAAIFERAAARGELPSSADGHLLTEQLLGALYLRLLVTGEALRGRIDEVIDLLLTGAGARHP